MATENEELYSSYVNNPYNLTLHVDQSFSNAPPPPPMAASMAGDATNVMQPSTNTSNLNVFQSVNYFGVASDAAIPPGSEVLFGNP